MNNKEIKDQYNILHNMITEQVKEKDEVMYNAMLFYVTFQEAQKGYKAVKEPKTTAAGTEITYEKMKAREYKKYLAKLKKKYLEPYFETKAA